jgi:hypothetical protein
MRIITIDIDSQAIKLLLVEDNRVKMWASSPLEDGIFEDGNIVDPQALAAQARRLRRSSGIPSGDVVASMSGLFSVARLLSFPAGSQPMTMERAREAIPGEGLRLHWQSVGMNGAGQDLLVIGANEERVDSEVGALRSAGLAPKVLELKSMALYRTVQKSQTLIANVESSTIDIVLVVDELPRVMRTIATVGDPSEEDLANQLARAFIQTVEYYNSSHNKEVSPEEIPLILVGTKGDDPSLRERVEERVNHPLETFTTGLECPPHLPAGQYAVNLGLAMRQLATNGENSVEAVSEPILINLAPQRRPFWHISRQTAGYLSYLGVGLIIAALLFQLLTVSQEDTARLEVAVEMISRQVAVTQESLIKAASIEKNITDFGGLTASWGSVTEARELLDGILIPGVTVSRITVSGDKLDFQASAVSIAVAIQFVELLRKDGRFEEIPFPRPTTSISATLDLAALP